MVDPQQSLGSAYHVSIEKIFVCSGLDGYIPQYSPDSGEYGCLADSKLLSYRFKILVSTISTYESFSHFHPPLFHSPQRHALCTISTVKFQRGVTVRFVHRIYFL